LLIELALGMIETGASSMIGLDRVSKSYGPSGSIIHALRESSLQVSKGEFIPSGSGKTTLLNLVGGMTRPDNGTIKVDGKDFGSMADADLARFRAGAIGFVFQFQSMLPTLSALDNVLLPLAFTDNQTDNKADELLAEVGLAERAQAFAHELSRGQQRRVCVARALSNEPQLLLCDEPTGDLDPDTEIAIMGMIANAHKKDATILMTTHNHELRSYATRNLRIEGGVIKEEEI